MRLDHPSQEGKFINAQLKEILAKLYSDEPSIRRVIDDAGLDSARILLASSPINIWNSVLAEAKNSNKVAALLDRVTKEYTENEKLQKACVSYNEAERQRQSAHAKSAEITQEPQDNQQLPRNTEDASTGNSKSRGRFRMISVSILVSIGMYVAVFWYLRSPEIMQTDLGINGPSSFEVLPVVTLEPMTGDFNVAIAQFEGVIVNNTQQTNYATFISKSLADFLDRELDGVEPKIQVMHSDLLTVTGKNQAEQLAEQLNADIVIYGRVDIYPDKAKVYPGFYVSSKFSVTELTGQTELGGPIIFTLPATGLQDLGHNLLNDRTMVLLYFIKGLMYRSTNSLDQAFSAFRQAITLAESLEDFKGKEVLYLMAGIISNLQHRYDDALMHFNHALTINPNFARGYIGRGYVYYQRTISEPDWKEDWLDEALIEFEKALKKGDLDQSAYIIEKVHIAKGNIYTVKVRQDSNRSLEFIAQALNEFNAITSKYAQEQTTSTAELKALAALAYYGAGIVYEQQCNKEQAMENYRKSQELTVDPSIHDLLEERLRIVQKSQRPEYSTQQSQTREECPTKTSA